MLVKDLKIDLLALKCGGNLAEMQGGTCEPIETRHHERITFPDIFQTGVQSGPLSRCTARFLLEDFMAAFQLVELDIEARSYWIPGSWNLRMVYTGDIPFFDP